MEHILSARSTFYTFFLVSWSSPRICSIITYFFFPKDLISKLKTLPLCAHPPLGDIGLTIGTTTAGFLSLSRFFFLKTKVKTLCRQ